MPKRSTPYRPMRLPDKLRAIRTRLNLSQSQMAKRLDFKGSHGRISEFEHGSKLPNLLVLLRYSQIVKLHMETLVDDRVSIAKFREALHKQKGLR